MTKEQLLERVTRETRASVGELEVRIMAYFDGPRHEGPGPERMPNRIQTQEWAVSFANKNGLKVAYNHNTESFEFRPQKED